MINNYTLVIPPLFPHYGNDDRGVQWFDQFYDLKKFSEVVDIVTLDQFLSKIKINENKAMIDCFVQQQQLVSERSWYSKNALITVQRHHKVNIDFHHVVNVSSNLSLNHLSAKAQSCSSIFLHIHYTTFRHFFQISNIYMQRIFRYFHRTPLIRRMASQSIKLLPKLAVGKNRSYANTRNFAAVHIRTGDHTVMNISVYIKQILQVINSGVRFTHLHIMCPYLDSVDMKRLMDGLPIAFTTSQHLLNHLQFVIDRYLFDVLEQEIACQAPMFLASPWTTYSATVMLQKVYQNTGIVYLLSTSPTGRPLLVTQKNVKYF